MEEVDNRVALACIGRVFVAGRQIDREADVHTHDGTAIGIVVEPLVGRVGQRIDPVVFARLPRPLCQRARERHDQKKCAAKPDHPHPFCPHLLSLWARTYLPGIMTCALGVPASINQGR